MSAASDKKRESGGTEVASEEESRGVKRTAEKSELDVHTANEWERAHIEGGDERKQKFLRLMGAGKKEHTGPVTIGEKPDQHQHGRSEKEEEELESNLKKQFETNLEYKLKGGARQHKGLGFHDEEKSKEEKEPKETVKDSEVKEDDKTDEDDKLKSKHADEISEKGKEQDAAKDSTQESKTPDASKKYSMSFVKASS